MYVSDIEMVVAANGASALFKPGVPRPLRRALIGPALSRGAYLAGEQARPVAGDALTVEQVIAAIRELMLEGDSKAFGVTGEPKLAPLRKKLGPGVTDDLRDAAWFAFQTGDPA